MSALQWSDLIGPIHERDKSIGNKALNLKCVSNIPGLLTPRGCAILPNFSKSVIESLREPILSILDDQSISHADRAMRIEALILDRAPEDLATWWHGARDRLQLLAPYAVRSSGHPVVMGRQLAEDSSASSLAGQYTSYLNLSVDLVVESIMRCIASLFNARSLEAFRAQDDHSYLESSMTVLIQEMIPVKASGVMMTVDPLEKRGDLLGIEGGCGPCAIYVDGSAQGDFFLWNRESCRIEQEEVGRRQMAHCRNSSTCSGETTCITAAEVEKIASAGLAIEAYFGSAQDIEFGLTAEGQLYILQARPITTQGTTEGTD